ncbi:squalene/phytoene synthase family protein [Gordonia sp. SID5947]|uniref:phytoene/squalene synthase family protein n=1 Tax=Gordonia sp. SID5947 TaxID=2690315 RepID=UPI0013707794|nr:squalene/phytoene synthase family protein [Gordonia sp. SID5947]MYR07340.1 squalene/phytoene synthase family protein [Gordonia sp. SID5947]
MRLGRTAESATPAFRHYDEVAAQSAALVIRSYSSSFGLASRLLAPPIRRDVHNIYALVRLADEIVDAPRPEQSVEQRRHALDALAADVAAALASGWSTNLVVHAFARTARRTGIDDALVDPFFTSMRADLDCTVHDENSLAAYIYGSAEVVGLMCVHAFLAEQPHRKARYDQLAPGARRLGAAFQKINFLRDLAQDDHDLGRRYLIGLEADHPSRDAWTRWLDDIDGDLTAAARAIPLLPGGTRVAVCTVHDLFAELARRLRATPPEVACRTRVRVSTPAKARIAAAATMRRGVPSTAGPAA